MEAQLSESDLQSPNRFLEPHAHLLPFTFHDIRTLLFSSILRTNF
jgi:hypothetical protein